MQAEVTMLQSAFCLRHTGTPITAKLRYWLTWMALMICKDKNGRLNAIGRIAKDVRRLMSDG